MNLTNEILNVSLTLSMEFGENWLKPINQRLKEKYLNLNYEELEEYNNICKKINNEAHNFIFNNPVKYKNKVELIDFIKFENYMKKKYEWISNNNMRRLYSQSCYYATK